MSPRSHRRTTPDSDKAPAEQEAAPPEATEGEEGQSVSEEPESSAGAGPSTADAAATPADQSGTDATPAAEPESAAPAADQPESAAPAADQPQPGAAPADQPESDATPADQPDTAATPADQPEADATPADQPQPDATHADQPKPDATPAGQPAVQPAAATAVAAGSAVKSRKSPPEQPPPNTKTRFWRWWRRFSRGRRVSGLGAFLMGVAILALSAFLVYTLIKIWPALQADLPKGRTARRFVPISWFGKKYSLTQEKALLLVVVLAGALGATLHVATSFGDYVGNRRLMRSWIWFYVLRPVVGAGLALLFYFAVRGGLFTTSSSSQDLNAYGMAALAGMVGLFSKQATNKLQQIFDAAFAVPEGQGDAARADSITNPTPTLTGVQPPQIEPGGLVEFTLNGLGFMPESQVQVSVLGQPAVPATATYVNAQTLTVDLEDEDVENVGALTFTVVNPDPGGGTSELQTVMIVAADSQADTTIQADATSETDTASQAGTENEAGTSTEDETSV